MSGIVLAGGRSSRFDGDKLGAIVDGKPLLHHAVEAVAAIADEVLVVARAVGAGPVLPESSVPLRVVRDPTPFAGALAGLITGARAARHPVLVVVGGDMPSLVPEVLRLLAAAVFGEVRAVALAGEGAPPAAQPLPIALARDAVLAALGAGRLRPERPSLRALLAALDASVIPAGAWRGLDPTAATLRDVDVPADLPASPGLTKSGHRSGQ